MANFALKLLIIFLILFNASLPPIMGLEQKSALFWTKLYGGYGDDRGYVFKATPDNGYLIVGSTTSYDAESVDILLIKTDMNGEVVWRENYGGSGSDNGASLLLIDEDCYLIVGNTDSFGDKDVYLLKVDSDGRLLWQTKYDFGGIENGNAILATSDGGYLIIGSTYSTDDEADILLIKLDSRCEVTWWKTFGGTSMDLGVSLLATQDGGFIIVGNTCSYGDGGWDVILINIDDYGNLLWQKTYGGENDDYAYSIHQSIEGGYVVAGATGSFGAGDAETSDGYIFVTDANGELTLQQTLGVTGESEITYSVIPNQRGGYFTLSNVGQRFNSEDNDPILVFFTDSNLKGEWNLTLGWDIKNTGTYIELTPDGGFSVIGSTTTTGYADIYFLHVNDRYAPHADAGSNIFLVDEFNVHFNGGNSEGPLYGKLVSYSWDFGDGTKGNGIDPSHKYGAIGEYNASLTVTDNNGKTSTDSIHVTIVHKPKIPVYTNVVLNIDRPIYSYSSETIVTMWTFNSSITYDEYWTLDRFVDGGWRKVDTISGDVGNIMFPSSSRKVAVEYPFFTLPNGLYRIGKTFGVDIANSDKKTTYVEFTISDNVLVGVPNLFFFSFLVIFPLALYKILRHIMRERKSNE